MRYHLRPVRTVITSTLILAVMLAAGCKRKDEAKCQDGQNGVRKSLEAGEDALLTQWRNYAYKYCEDQGALAALDKEVADTRAAKAKALADQARAQQGNDQLLALFSGWVGQNKANPMGAAAAVTCEGGKPEEKSKERWCTRQRQAGAHALVARYWEKDPQAVKFDTRIPLPITCEKLGGARVIRSWTVPGQPIKRHHCEITSGPMAGLQAMVSEANNAPLHVFSPQYLELDTALKAKLTSEGG